MGEAGRQRVLPRYAVERLIGDVDGLYRRLLEQKRRHAVSAAACSNAANAGFSLRR